MALSIPVKQTDGVTTNYHRILYLQITTNRQNSIVVSSYVDKESRGNEGAYTKCVTYETAYDETMSVEKAYNYLKSLPQFVGAEDV